MRLQPTSFAKRLNFYLRGKKDVKAGVLWCPYTPNSTEASLWWRGFAGKQAPINKATYLVHEQKR